jgi:hypothetical protein
VQADLASTDVQARARARAIINRVQLPDEVVAKRINRETFVKDRDPEKVRRPNGRGACPLADRPNSREWRALQLQCILVGGWLQAREDVTVCKQYHTFF